MVKACPRQRNSWPAKLIKSEFAFIFQSKFYDYETIYPGTYTLNTSMTSKEILQQLNEKPETEEDVKPAQSGAGKDRYLS